MAKLASRCRTERFPKGGKHEKGEKPGGLERAQPCNPSIRGGVWYARFWDEQERRYAVIKSTECSSSSDRR